MPPDVRFAGRVRAPAAPVQPATSTAHAALRARFRRPRVSGAGRSRPAPRLLRPGHAVRRGRHGGGAGALLFQFGGPAFFSILAGAASIVMPFVAGYYFIVLPIAGLASAVRAIQRGRLLGGMVGIVLNAVGGIVSLLASGIVGPGS
jgi:hypothetical protein